MSLPKEGAEYIEKDYKSEKKKSFVLGHLLIVCKCSKNQRFFFNLQLKCIIHIV